MFKGIITPSTKSLRKSSEVSLSHKTGIHVFYKNPKKFNMFFDKKHKKAPHFGAGL
jgi:hypothetical protein